MEGETETGTQGKLEMNFSKSESNALLLLLVVTAAIFVFQIIPIQGLTGAATQNSISGSGGINLDSITNQVVPENGFTINAKWGGIVKKMVDTGALDPAKLEDILVKKYGQQMKPEWKDILAGKDSQLSINAENSVFMMYILWVLAKHNDNKILHDSPFAGSFGPDYDIGAGSPGYGNLKLLSLTPEQQAVATKVAENSYRPCCGQSAARPDCSHGYSALGLMQLMASQGFSEKEIFDAFVKFNTFWFPANYIQAATYFKLAENKDWDRVDKELVAGPQFSSAQGSSQVKQYLQKAGI